MYIDDLTSSDDYIRAGRIDADQAKGKIIELAKKYNIKKSTNDLCDLLGPVDIQ